MGASEARIFLGRWLPSRACLRFSWQWYCSRLPEWGYAHLTVNHGRGEYYALDEDGDGFNEVHVNTMEGCWSLLRSWLRPHRGVSQEKLPLYIALFEFVHNPRK